MVSRTNHFLISTRSTFYSLLHGLHLRKTNRLPEGRDFADSICAATEKFTKGYGYLVNQLNRAALSISANIAEGNGRFTVRDRQNFFGIARGSVQECVPLLELATRRNLISTTNRLD